MEHQLGLQNTVKLIFFLQGQLDTKANSVSAAFLLLFCYAIFAFAINSIKNEWWFHSLKKLGHSLHLSNAFLCLKTGGMTT